MEHMVEYPDIYYRVRPIAEQCVNTYYPVYNPIYQMPNNEQMNTMIDDVYEEVIKDLPEIEQDTRERRAQSRLMNTQSRPYYGRRRLMRDIIGIIIIDQLLRRRRSPYGYGPGYRPGYGPGRGYGPGYGPGYY